MSTTFRPYAPDQMLLLPADLRAWLPEGHLAHHVSDLVDGVDLTAFYAPYAGDGRRNAPYAPRMMVKVLLYAYATGVFSSRGIARKLEEDVAFRVLGAGNFPQHRTLCEFRRRHLSDFKELFVAVGRLARFGKLSIDGTKVRANASKRKAMSDGRMAKEERRLRGEIEARLAAAGAADAAEDARVGADVRGDELPAELRRREDRLAAIRAAKSRLEAQQRAADDARGRQPDQDRNPKGGPPYKRSYGEAGREGAEQLHGPGERDHEDEQRRVPAVLQRAGGGRWCAPVGGGDGGDGERERPGWCAGAARRAGGDGRRAAGDGAGGRRLRQRAGLGGPGNARHRRVCVLGPGGEGGQAPRPGEVSRDESHGREAVEAGGPCGVCRTQVAVGGSQRLGQARAGIPTLQPAGAGEGAGRVGLGVPGVEHQAPARPDGGVTRGE